MGLIRLRYRLRLDIGQKLFFFEVLKGTDRTMGTEHPCIFTRDYGNVLTQDYSEDDTNYRNVCLVGGSGEDPDRILATAGSASGIERHEMFYNASGISNKDMAAQEYIEQLVQKGNEKLTANYIAKAFESKINKKKAMMQDHQPETGFDRCDLKGRVLFLQGDLLSGH